jgi:hypothetical protein
VLRLAAEEAGLGPDDEPKARAPLPRRSADAPTEAMPAVDEGPVFYDIEADATWATAA